MASQPVTDDLCRWFEWPRIFTVSIPSGHNAFITSILHQTVMSFLVVVTLLLHLMPVGSGRQNGHVFFHSTCFKCSCCFFYLFRWGLYDRCMVFWVSCNTGICREYDCTRAVFCAKLGNDLTTEMNVLDERNFAICDVNPLCVNFFRGNINIFIHFMSILHTDMPLIVEILPLIRPGFTYFT